MRFIFTCGGTAGHIYPALAVATKLREILPSSDILFIGATDMMEMNIVPDYGFDIINVDISNLSRDISIKGFAHNLKTLKNVLVSIGQSKRIIKSFEPDCVIGTGGYVCYPVLKAANRLGIPTVIHESNAYPGLTTRLLDSVVDVILTGGSCVYYKDNPKAFQVGTPVRSEFLSLDKTQAKSLLNINKPMVLSVMGSLGAEHMNNVISDMILQMGNNPDFHLIHVTGNKYYDNFTPKNSADVEVYPYITDIAKYMIASDLVICRAGASTISELTYIGKPCILVPSPNVTENHQEKNARVLEKNGAARVLLESDFNSNTLLELIKEILNDSELQKNMAESSKSFSNDSACDDIVSHILSLIKDRGINGR